MTAVRFVWTDCWVDGRERLPAAVPTVPRVWPEYHENYFGAFMSDPDGNNVEAVSHAAE